MAQSAASTPLSHLWIEQSPTAIAIFDRNLCCVVASERWRKLYGLDSDQAVQGVAFAQLVPSLPEHWTAVLQRSLNGSHESSDGEVVTLASGKRAWVQWESSPWRDETGAIAGVIWCGMALTQQKRRELRQQQYYENLRMILDHSVQLMALLSPDGRILEVNNTTLVWARLQRESLVGMLFWDVPWWEMSVSMQAKLKGAIAKAANGEWVQRDITVYRGDEVKTLSFSITPITDERGQVLYLLPEGHDVSDRKAVEQALAQSEANWLAAQKIAHVGSWEWNILTGRVTWSDEIFRIYGLPIEQTPPSFDEQAQHIHPDDRQRFYTTLYNTIYREDPYSLEFRILRPDQSIRYIYAQGQPLRTETGEVSHLAGVLMDISDRKHPDAPQPPQVSPLELEKLQRELQRTQSHLIQNEKMSSLGQLLAGVAHEINNPVNFIYGNLRHAEDYVNDILNLLALYQKGYPQPHADIVEEAEAMDLEFLVDDLPQIFSSMQMGADRIKEIVASLRNFSRTDETEVKSMNLHDGIESTLIILQNRLKPRSESPGIQIIKQYSNIPPIDGYPGQFNQVLMNILSNAIDALEERDQHRTYAEIEADPSIIKIATALHPPNYVELSLADNGPGIPTEIQSRLFDEFFTTKPVGKGTGLGLSISYKIITERHHGELVCQSTPGQGTEFIITIPIQHPSDGD
ncbi:PAS domain-containing protein [Spirulina major CS-329]|uniref:PAS domain-containing protein n=1 Tax=Spirulina TaxID=1154 RepID=UPI00232FCBE2|nr:MULTISPECIES: PAS domain-containing protein [Spirulina]MDB9496480.1 PAS domain-containing protein [Spirulina subsalsa CS-330]MDB9504733.1 PAS domain-containing protein [Spirulina major CS-329]